MAYIGAKIIRGMPIVLISLNSARSLFPAERDKMWDWYTRLGIRLSAVKVATVNDRCRWLHYTTGDLQNLANHRRPMGSTSQCSAGLCRGVARRCRQKPSSGEVCRSWMFVDVPFYHGSLVNAPPSVAAFRDVIHHVLWPAPSAVAKAYPTLKESPVCIIDPVNLLLFLSKRP